MRRFFWAIVILILWDTVCVYWFVCGIKNLCEQPKPVEVVVAVEPPPLPPKPEPIPEPTPPPKPEPETSWRGYWWHLPSKTLSFDKY